MFNSLTRDFSPYVVVINYILRNRILILLQKTVNQKTTIYEIQDDRGKMDVVGTGQCHNIPCEEGDKLQLYCFRLRKKNQMSKLISEMHSFIQVRIK